MEGETSGGLELNADGELVGSGPAEFAAVPRALRFLVGPGYVRKPTTNLGSDGWCGWLRTGESVARLIGRPRGSGGTACFGKVSSEVNEIWQPSESAVGVLWGPGSITAVQEFFGPSWSPFSNVVTFLATIEAVIVAVSLPFWLAGRRPAYPLVGVVLLAATNSLLWTLVGVPAWTPRGSFSAPTSASRPSRAGTS
ncbi:MAG: hypothetical protein M3R38_02435 [Actinomycetota bacterium]|nr:hypothetical protein [Actinomycetota bacterium]